MQKHFNISIALFTISFGLYLTEIYDIFLNFEIITTLLGILLLFVAIGLFIASIIRFIHEKQSPNKITLILSTTLAISFSIIYSYREGYLTEKIFIKAKFIDDRSRIDIKFYKSGKYVIYSNWLFGEERFEGTYKLKKDTIEFNNYPLMENDLIAQKVILIKDKIYFKKDNKNEYDKSFYYFQIE